MIATETVLMTEKRNQRIGEVVREYGKRLFGFIRGRVPSDDDASDILQDVWFQLSNVVNLDEISQLSGWLFKVARNRIIDKYRRPKSYALEDFEGMENEMGELKEILFSEDPDPETKDLQKLFWEELFTALDELPEKQRQVFVWNELEDMTLQEIAEKTGENLKTIISRKGYAVKHLRERLLDLYIEFQSY